MKTNTLLSIGGIVVVILLLLIYLSAYTVTEGQQAVLLRSGKLVTTTSGQPIIQDAGLHFKWPFITQVKFLDIRLQNTAVNSLQASTADQKDVVLSYYAKWRIANVANYIAQSGGNQVQTQTTLTQQLNDTVQKTINQTSLVTLITKQANVFTQVKQAISSATDRLGIQIVDLQAKSIVPATDVVTAIYEQMRAGWQQQAAQIRASGKASAADIRTNANAKVALILANAKLQAAQIRSQGDAQAASIYAQASSKDPDFYIFLRSLEAYRKVFNSNATNTIVLKPDTQFFKYFNGVNGQETSLRSQRHH